DNVRVGVGAVDRNANVVIARNQVPLQVIGDIVAIGADAIELCAAGDSHAAIAAVADSNRAGDVGADIVASHDVRIGARIGDEDAGYGVPRNDVAFIGIESI